MTPSLFDLPVRTNEAAELANLVLEIAGEKVLTDDIRQRIAQRSKLLSLPNTNPHFGSLERDPIHPPAIYLAIDGVKQQPLLLRMAPSSTPSSGIFPKSILIGRVRGPKNTELVINAVPFARQDHESVRQFAAEINPAFQPRPAGNRTALIVATTNPESAFHAFRSVLKQRNLNIAGIEDGPAGTWAAIRTGWREGWVNQDSDRTLHLISENPEDILAAAQQMTA